LALTTATFRRSPRGKTGRICLWSQRSWIRRRPALTQLCKLNLAMTWCTTRISRNHKKFVKESTTTSKRWTFQFQCTTCSKKTECFNCLKNFPTTLILSSQAHLPRSKWLCKHLVGLLSLGQSNARKQARLVRKCSNTRKLGSSR
jgi:hypothetical protein